MQPHNHKQESFMITLLLKDTGAHLGSIDEADMKLMIDQLEEEHRSDTDYYIDAATIDMLAQKGASSHLLKVLNEALGSSEGIDIVWKS
jgi:hypothetical protein